MTKTEVGFMNELGLYLLEWFERPQPKSAVNPIAGFPIALGSDVGLRRDENQDRVAVVRGLRNDPFFLAMLCDGMGGMAEGAKSAALSISAFIEAFVAASDADLPNRMAIAASHSNMTVHEKYYGRGGATLSALAIGLNGNVECINIGDSRIYTYTKAGIKQLTRDDTIAAQLPFNTDFADHSNELLQYIGMGPGIALNSISIPSADRVQTLLTSDGLHFVGDAVLESILKQNAGESASLARYLALSKWYGGHDNASCISFNLDDSFLRKWFDSSDKIMEIWGGSSELAVLNMQSPLPTKREAKRTDNAVVGEKPVRKPKKQSVKKKKEPEVDNNVQIKFEE